MNPEQQYQNGQQNGVPADVPPVASTQPVYQTPAQSQPSAPQPAPPGGYYQPAAPDAPATAQPVANGQSNPYEFIFAEKPIEKKGFFDGASLLKRILVIIGGLAVLTIIVVLATSLFSSKDTINSRLFTIAQEQQEIIRVAGVGSAKVTGTDARNFALNTELSLTTDQSATLTYIKAHKGKVDEKLLGAKADADTDKTLETAATNNTYDATLVQTLHSQLVTYRTNLNTTYQQISGKNARALLADSYKAADLLIAEANKITASN